MSTRIYEQSREALAELCEKAKLTAGSIVVVGCSTSEVTGAHIGTNSNPEVAAEIFRGLQDVAREKGIFLAVQCCEHLNRAIITQRSAVPFAQVVNVIPQPKAGGSLATCAYASLPDAVAVEQIQADAGLDIGFTLIGMHLKQVAVPVRLEHNAIGSAMVLAARTRPKFIGGIRAVYDDKRL